MTLASLLFLLPVAVGLVTRDVLRNHQALCRRSCRGALTVSMCHIGMVAFWWHSLFLCSPPRVPCNNFTHGLLKLTQNRPLYTCAVGWYFVASLPGQWARQLKYNSGINSWHWLHCCSCCMWLSGLWPGRYLGTIRPCAEDPVGAL